MTKLLFAISVATLLSLSSYSQNKTQEILTVPVQWVNTPIGNSVAYICTPDGNITTQELNGKFTVKGLPETSSSLTVLLNQLTKEGWVLISTSSLRASFYADLFIFEK